MLLTANPIVPTRKILIINQKTIFISIDISKINNPKKATIRRNKNARCLNFKEAFILLLLPYSAVKEQSFLNTNPFYLNLSTEIFKNTPDIIYLGHLMVPQKGLAEAEALTKFWISSNPGESQSVLEFGQDRDRNTESPPDLQAACPRQGLPAQATPIFLRESST